MKKDSSLYQEGNYNQFLNAYFVSWMLWNGSLITKGSLFSWVDHAKEFLGIVLDRNHAYKTRKGNLIWLKISLKNEIARRTNKRGKFKLDNFVKLFSQFLFLANFTLIYAAVSKRALSLSPKIKQCTFFRANAPSPSSISMCVFMPHFSMIHGTNTSLRSGGLKICPTALLRKQKNTGLTEAWQGLSGSRALLCMILHDHPNKPESWAWIMPWIRLIKA